MTHVEMTKYMRQRELAKRALFNAGKENPFETNKYMANWDEVHYQQKLRYAEYLDAQQAQAEEAKKAKEESAPLNVNITSTVKVKK